MTAPLATPRRDLTHETIPFAGELVLRALPPTYRRFCLGESIVYDSALVGAVVVPEGTITDFASVPRPLWWLFPPCGRYAPAALAHDHMYRTHRTGGGRYGIEVTRREADGVFLAAMADLGVGRATRYAMWAAVRACGWHAWRATS